jgi:hypothetical protein
MVETVVFIPCAKKQDANGTIVGQGVRLFQADLPNTWNLLFQTRRQMRRCIKNNTPLTSAIYLYRGLLYGPLQPHIPLKLKEIEQGRLRIIIISPCYGIVDAREPLNEYDCKMKGKIATAWRNNGLVDIISDLLLTWQPSKVFGYFTGPAGRQGSHAKYRYFFTEGLRSARQNGLKIQCGGCFYRVTGGGRPALKALGQTLVDHNNSGLNCAFANNILTNGRIDGNVTIGFDPL